MSDTIGHSTSCLSTIAPRSRRGCSVFFVPLTAEQTARIAASKQVVYDGLKLALTKGAPREAAGILVDEQFGAAILRDARANGLIACAPAENEPPAGGAAARAGRLCARERPAFHVRIVDADDARAVRLAGGRPAPL
jgi:hypothetical protein